MAYKKIISITIIICMVVSITGCGTLDIMKGLKSDTNPDISDVSDLSDFAIVDDSIEQGTSEESVETITVNAADTKLKEIVAYYEDENGFVVPVNTEIPWEEGIAKATIRSMVIGNEIEQRIAQSGLHGVLPENTEIKGMSIKDGLCRVDFSQNILNTESYEQEQNMVSALTYTLTEFPTIDKVEVLVEGKELASLSKGYAINTAFERKNINLLGSENGSNYTVYYKSPDTEVAGYYVPITFSADKVENPVVTVMEKLFNGPPADLQVSNKIPYGINLQGVNIQGDTAVLNLGIGAVNLSQEEYEDMNKIVVLCLKQFGDIANVDFQIEGLSFEEAGLNFEDNNVTPVFNQY
ncbi:germination protein M [Sedimentibacter acidaminivorans]|uniref:Germination protein M n=1 Tax=Sedimentibacter acidaminivorans TaxID=913099 RepID=A0ABS4GDW7_9FIRM|nr:GerMN domain-containing protein [Sedimentibacter acidaminivorans]MBP1925897.1 germination protein M [Sedimentibacter acidaminivorans]